MHPIFWLWHSDSACVTSSRPLSQGNCRRTTVAGQHTASASGQVCRQSPLTTVMLAPHRLICAAADGLGMAVSDTGSHCQSLASQSV